MIISGEKIYLRMILESDLDWYYGKVNDIELNGLYWPASVSSVTEFKDWFHRSGFWDSAVGQLFICDLNDHRIVGVLIYVRAHNYYEYLELGYRLLDLQLGGRGIVTEALSLFNYVLFLTKKINRVELRIDPENPASKRIAEKCGYRFEGVGRGVAFLRGEYRDTEVYSLLRSEAPTSRDEALNRIRK